MAGAVSHTPRSASARARRLIAIAVGGALLGLLLIGGGEVPAARAQVSCPALPSGLSPASSGSQSFTMMIRINTQGNVDTYTKPEGGMGGRIRPQDIFVLNTRFTGSGQFPAMTSDVVTQLAANLRGTFPCNRIIALNGMSFDPAQAGYAFSGVGDPNVFALLTDYEQMDYNQGRATDPSRPPWKTNFPKAFPLLRGWNLGFTSTVATNPIGTGKRTGLAPEDVADWNYGQIAQNLNKHNARLGDRKLGPMSVQTQDACANGGSRGFGARAKQLRLHYTFKSVTRKVKKRVHGKIKRVRRTFQEPIKKKGKPLLSNTAMQISFTATPQASKSQAILSTSPAQAAACVGPAIKQGVGAFFFFASDDSMRLLFQQPQVNALRPATAGSANTGGVGSP